MIVEDTIYERRFSLECSNIFSSGLKIIEMASKYGQIIEKKNTYETNGPSHRTEMAFDIIKHTDDFSSVKISFSIKGHENVLEIEMSGIFYMEIDDERFFNRVFSEFYSVKIFPKMKKAAVRELSDMMSSIEEKIKENEEIAAK